MEILWIIGPIVVIAIFVIGYYNSIITSKNNVKRNWADVMNYERMKLKLIPKLEGMVKEFKEFEQSILTKLTELRSAIASLPPADKNAPIGGQEELKAVQAQTAGILASFRATAEAYPNIKASDLYKGVMKSLEEAEKNVAAQITIYNGGVQSFNNTIQTFPGNIINGLINKEQPINEFTDSEAKASIEYQPNL